MRFPRSPSLLLTFAGAFLVALVLGGLLQGLVVLAVVRPVTAQWVARDARDFATRAAVVLAEGAAHPAPGGASLGMSAAAGNAEEVRAALIDVTGGRGAVLLFVARDGEIVASDRSLLRWRRRVAIDLAKEGYRIGSADIASAPTPPRGPGARGERGERGEPGASGERNERIDRGPALHVVARAPLVTTDGMSWEVLAVARDPRIFAWPIEWPMELPRPGLLFLPVAALVAGGAGFALFRVLSRRLRRLEDHAERVASGDLSARIADPGSDELGRLGASLNAMTARLAEARLRVEEADGTRRRLLADVTHELATPLTSIRGYAETLLNPAVPMSAEERHSALDAIRDEAARMDRLVQDVLDLARLEAGAAMLEPEEIDWTALCRAAMRRFEHRFRESALTLRWRDDPRGVAPGGNAPDGIVVRADARRLEQVIDNLLSNALRYVPAGGAVSVSIEAHGEVARLRVEDDGPGFPSSDLPHVFDRFYRADAARAAGGSGLGLAIVREIARRHGGEVRAENHLPQGARIDFEIPIGGSDSIRHPPATLLP